MPKITYDANASFLPEVPADGEGGFLPTEKFLDIGGGSSISYARESRGVNSGAHNKSAEQLLECFEAEEERLLKVVSVDIKRLLTADIG